MTAHDAEIRWRLRPERVSWKRVGDEVVALDVRASEYVAVDGAGTELWARLASPVSAAELAIWMAEHYGIDVDRARQDVEVFLDELNARDLLERVS
jgi:hypothetical protein